MKDERLSSIRNLFSLSCPSYYFKWKSCIHMLYIYHMIPGPPSLLTLLPEAGNLRRRDSHRERGLLRDAL
jgi:hypothetical protein